jgi:hypothetical protein
MSSQSQLIQQIKNTIGKAKVLELTKIMKKEQFALNDLIDLTFYADKDIAFRASWLLENIYLQNPEHYIDNLDYLLQHFTKVVYPSCQRHYAKIIMHITSPKAPKVIKAALEHINLEQVIERLFEWMIEPNVKIAVKGFASHALFNMRDKHTWLTEELANQIQYLMRNGTPAIQSRGRKLLKQLQT